MVPAALRARVGDLSATFDAEPCLEALRRGYLALLIEEDWRCCFVANRVARLAESRCPEVAAFFAKLRDEQRRDRDGFECAIDAKAASAWLSRVFESRGELITKSPGWKPPSSDVGRKARLLLTL